MKLAIAHLKSAGPYSQNDFVQEPKKPRETSDDHEKRTWKERCHVNDDGYIFIPPTQFANSLKDAALYLSLQVPGKGKSTYTKNFDSGVMVTDPLVLPIHIDEVEHEWINVPSDGRRGGGKRVRKCFALIPEWEGQVIYHVLDDIITDDVFKKVLRVSGSLIGIGRFRPRNRGYYGRFTIEGFDWQEVSLDEELNNEERIVRAV